MGTHNVSNAAAVIALLAELGYSAREIAGSISDFNGTNRRQELLFKNQITGLLMITATTRLK
jgi:UDP-N-acetylmuramate-alanine ligase